MIEVVTKSEVSLIFSEVTPSTVSFCVSIPEVDFEVSPEVWGIVVS